MHLLVCYLNKLQNARCNDTDIIWILKFSSCGMSLCVDRSVVTNNSAERTASNLMVKQSRRRFGAEDGSIRRLAASLTLYQMTRCNIPEDLTLHYHSCENLRSSIMWFCLSLLHNKKSLTLWSQTPSVFFLPSMRKQFLYSTKQELRLYNCVF